MQSKGAIRLVAILLAIACIWQLSYTAVTGIQEGKAAKRAQEKAEAFARSGEFAKIAAEDQAYFLDSLRKNEEKRYTDSISSEKVYLGNTFKEVKAKEINLGLDLKGGMNVMLQVQLEDLVRALSGNNQTPAFQQAIAQAKSRSVNSQSDFITLFAEAWKEASNGQRLSQVFGTYEMRERIKPESTDEQVLSVIREEAESAVSNSFNVLRNRIDRFGVTQPSIQKIGNTGRILVELPGVKEPERVRKLLQGTASLEFWTTFDAAEITPYLQEANALLAQYAATEEEEGVEEADESDLVAREIQAQAGGESDIEAFRKANPLFAVLQPSNYRGNACIGFAAAADTAAVGKYLRAPEVADLFPAEFRPMWSVKPSEMMQGDNIFELIAIKASSRDGKAPLDGGVVTDARVTTNDRRGGNPSVSMTMNAEGANIWARLTKD
ncbi:MAG: protein translocase subunit SecDF, partial [Bacteroidales bacterium]|nr:protein translocase subunit SecDF [Bacteroidales bacterium]